MSAVRAVEPLQRNDVEEVSQLQPAHPPLYRPDIDGLRAVAALAVVAAHAGWLHGGGFGVDIFFVISGFLISGIIFRALQDRRFSLLDFYERRVKRIFPALISLLVSMIIFAGVALPSPERWQLGQDVIFGALFIENLWIYASDIHGNVAASSALDHLWTLGIEEQFYLIWPLFLSGIWLRFQRWRLQLVALTAVLSLGSYGWVLFNDPGGWLLPWNRLWELALGAILAYLQHAKSSGVRQTWMSPFLHPPISHVLGTAGALGIVIALVGPAPLDEWPSGYAWVPVFGAFLVISAGRDHWINRRILSARPMVFMGLISYPLYLWHWSLFMAVSIWHGHTSTSGFRELPVAWKIVAIAASVALAHLTYRYIELPLRSSRNTSGVALWLCVAMAVSGLFAYFTLR